MVRKERQGSPSPQLARFSNDSPQLKQASTPLYQTRQPRYTSQHTSGHRQVVRHQLPKLTLAGSNPVARSSKKRLKPVRICKANTRTSRCPLHRAREAWGRQIQQSLPRCLRESEEIAHSRCTSATRARRRPVARSISQGGCWDTRLDLVSFGGFVDRGMPTAAGAYLRNKYADVPMPALMLQNVRLMPTAHTRTCARYNGWVTTNVPITKKEPL